MHPRRARSEEALGDAVVEASSRRFEGVVLVSCEKKDGQLSGMARKAKQNSLIA